MAARDAGSRAAAKLRRTTSNPEAEYVTEDKVIAELRGDRRAHRYISTAPDGSLADPSAAPGGASKLRDTVRRAIDGLKDDEEGAYTGLDHKAVPKLSREDEEADAKVARPGQMGPMARAALESAPPPDYTTVEIFTEEDGAGAYTLWFPWELAPSDYLTRILHLVRAMARDLVGRAIELRVLDNDRDGIPREEYKQDTYQLLKVLKRCVPDMAEMLVKDSHVLADARADRSKAEVIARHQRGLQNTLYHGFKMLMELRNEQYAHRVAGVTTVTREVVGLAFTAARTVARVLAFHRKAACAVSRQLRRFDHQFELHMQSKYARRGAAMRDRGLEAAVGRAVVCQMAGGRGFGKRRGAGADGAGAGGAAAGGQAPAHAPAPAPAPAPALAPAPAPAPFPRYGMAPSEPSVTSVASEAPGSARPAGDEDEDALGDRLVALIRAASVPSDDEDED